MSDLNPRDFMMSAELEKLMHTELWKWLVTQWEVRREIILHKGMKARNEDSCRKEWGKLEGFEYAVSMPQEIIQVILEQRSKKSKADIVEEITSGL